MSACLVVGRRVTQPGRCQTVRWPAKTGLDDSTTLGVLVQGVGQEARAKKRACARALPRARGGKKVGWLAPCCRWLWLAATHGALIPAMLERTAMEWARPGEEALGRGGVIRGWQHSRGGGAKESEGIIQ